MEVPGNSDRSVLLLQRWHAGDEAALHALLESHLPRLRAFVSGKLEREFRALRCEQDSLDLVQTAAAKVLAYLPRFVPRDGDQFQRLLHTFVLNDLRNRLRDRRTQGVREHEADFSASHLDLRAPSSAKPERVAQKAERQADIRAWVRMALEFLPEQDQRLFHLRAVEEQPWEVIAEELGLSADAARQRFRRAQPRLANHIRLLQGGRIDELLDSVGP